MPDTPQRWRAVGQQLTARMAELGGLRQADLTKLSGRSGPTVRPYMQGRPAPYSPSTRAAICAAVGWTADSIDRILDGKTPRPLPGTRAPAAKTAPGPAEISRRLERVESALGLLEEVVRRLDQEAADRRSDAEGPG